MKNKIHYIVFVLIFLLLTVKESNPSVWPISNSSDPAKTDQLTGDYGPRVTTSGADFHFGIDLRAQTPKLVHAVKGGLLQG